MSEKLTWILEEGRSPEEPFDRMEYTRLSEEVQREIIYGDHTDEELLRLSAEMWKAKPGIYKRDNFHGFGYDDCPMCIKYYHGKNDEYGICNDCPIANQVNDTVCRGTPYPNAVDDIQEYLSCKEYESDDVINDAKNCAVSSIEYFGDWLENLANKVGGKEYDSGFFPQGE